MSSKQTTPGLFKQTGKNTMVSINYVASNAAVVRSMKAVAAQLSETQERIATGYRINAASDNGSVWATAQTIRSDLAAQDVVKGDIGVAKAKADVAAAALDTIGGLLDQIKEKTVAAQASGASFTALAADVAALKSQIAAVIGGATVNNVNWLSGTGGAQSVNVDISGGTAVPLSVTRHAVELPHHGRRHPPAGAVQPRRRRHGGGVRQAPGAAGQAAARLPGAVDRQLLGPEHPAPLPVGRIPSQAGGPMMRSPSRT
jgi:hypothetical protein